MGGIWEILEIPGETSVTILRVSVAFNTWAAVDSCSSVLFIPADEFLVLVLLPIYHYRGTRLLRRIARVAGMGEDNCLCFCFYRRFSRASGIGLDEGVWRHALPHRRRCRLRALLACTEGKKGFLYHDNTEGGN